MEAPAMEEVVRVVVHVAVRVVMMVLDVVVVVEEVVAEAAKTVAVAAVAVAVVAVAAVAVVAVVEEGVAAHVAKEAAAFAHWGLLETERKTAVRVGRVDQNFAGGPKRPARSPLIPEDLV